MLDLGSHGPGRPAPSDGAWWRSAAIYQLYVRSFADANGDGTGDLAGVRAHLSYLAGLGIDAIWFNPWYPSPMSDAGYDISDYRSIEPVFGTLADADALIAEAHALGIRIIIDIVPNHGSDQHPWFTAALAAAPGSAERDKFWFRPGRGAGWRAAAERLAVHLRRPGVDPDHRARRVARRVVPAPVRARAAGLQLGEPGRAGRVRRCAPVLVRPRRRRHPDRLGRPADQRLRAARGQRGRAAGPVASRISDRDDVHEIYRSWRALADEYTGPRPDRRDLDPRCSPAGPVRQSGRAAHRLQLPVPELPVGRCAAARGHRQHSRAQRAGRSSCNLGSVQPRCGPDRVAARPLRHRVRPAAAGVLPRPAGRPGARHPPGQGSGAA